VGQRASIEGERHRTRRHRSAALGLRWRFAWRLAHWRFFRVCRRGMPVPMLLPGDMLVDFRGLVAVLRAREIRTDNTQVHHQQCDENTSSATDHGTKV
jgi:hypothetical protein